MDAKSNNFRASLPTSAMIGVVGAGTMGAGIAQVAALAGHGVLLFDTRNGAAESAIAGISESIDKLVKKGRVPVEQAAQVRSGLLPVVTIDDLKDCTLVIEAIVESLEAKRTLFRDLEEIVAADALLATNTSSISVTSIAALLKNPERLAGMHFFNPASLMPLVEVISGAATSTSVAECIYATAAKWGKIPVHAKSSPGFIVNRVARPFYSEALRVLQEGASDCATIDAVMRESGGFRMGPFELMDLIGNDVNYAVTRSVYEGFNRDARFEPSTLQQELVDAGNLGRKTGRGFYRYDDGAPASLPSTAEPCPVPKDIRIYDGGFFSEALMERLRKAKVSFVRCAAHADGRIADSSECVLYLTDGRTALAQATQTGIKNTVLVDLALDPISATRLAITSTHKDNSFTHAAGLLQTAGYAVSEIDDIPGMIVLRTVTMLANEAADAVDQGVCSAADCDLAMRKGVNYPLGPLDWADKFGIEKIARALDNMRDAYGLERYRVSPLLRQKALTGHQFIEENEKNG
jgi:3-hydroxybutyryl-CoA dehydrogenase